MIRVVIEILRYLALSALILGVAAALPAVEIAGRLRSALTDPQTYASIVRDLGLGERAGSLLSLAAAYVPGLDGGDDRIEKKGEDDPRVTRIRAAVQRAVDDAAVTIVSQIPGYIAHERDHLSARIDLRQAKKDAAAIAQESLPIGDFLAGPLQTGVDAAFPDTVSIDEPLSQLETLLLPARKTLGALDATLRTGRDFAWGCLALIVLVAFRLHRVGLWIGIALTAAGIGGFCVSGATTLLLELILPDALLDNRTFDALFLRGLHDATNTAVLWLASGLVLALLAATRRLWTPLLSRGVAATGLREVASVLEPRGRPASLATLITAPVACASMVLARRRHSRWRTAMDAARIGRTAAATVLDAAIVPGLVFGLGKLLGAVVVFELLGHLLVLPLWVLVFIYWSLRDRPRRVRTASLADRLAGVVRAPLPGRSARAGSFRRAIPLFAAAFASLFASLPTAFTAVCCAELITLAATRGRTTLGDLIAGTRPRLVRDACATR